MEIKSNSLITTFKQNETVSTPKTITTVKSNAQGINKDVFEISNKTTEKTNKNLIVILGIAIAGLAMVFGAKQISNRYYKQCQKTFNEYFMRDDISLKETKEILKRYKEINKIRDKENHIKALFEETKKNLGLGKDLELIMCKLPSSKGGSNYSLTNTIIINNIWDRKKLENATFHELRHAKQDLLAINTDLDRFILYNNNIEVTSIKEKNDFLPLLQRKVGYTDFSPEKVPEKYKDFVEKCFKSYEEYQTIRLMPAGKEKTKKYRETFLEKDAFEMANKMTKCLYGFTVKFLKN